MSDKPSTALRALERAVSALPADLPVTWGQLQDKLAEAASEAEQGEWETYMGDDL